MAVRRLSEIAPAGPANITDTLVGVQGGTTDVQFMIGNLIPYIPATGNVTFFVSTTGSNSNDGSAAHPFATLQHALNELALFNYQGQFVPTVNVADGTYNLPDASGIVCPQFYGLGVGAYNQTSQTQYVQVNGNKTTPGNCILVCPNQTLGPTGFTNNFAGGILLQGFLIRNASDCIQCSAGAICIDDMILEITGFNDNAVNTFGVGSVQLGNIDLKITVTGALNGATFVLFAKNNSSIEDFGARFIIGNAIACSAVISCGDNASIGWASGGVTNQSNLTGPQFNGVGGGFFFGGGFVSGDFSRAGMPGNAVGTNNPNPPHNILNIDNDAALTIATPTSGSTYTVYSHTPDLVLNPASALATLTIVLPGYVVKGERIKISTTQTITSLTVSAPTYFGLTPSIVGAPTTLAAGGVFELMYDTASTTWYIH